MTRIWWNQGDLKYIRQYLGVEKKKLWYTNNDKLFLKPFNHLKNKNLIFATVDYRKRESTKYFQICLDTINCSTYYLRF